MEVPGPGGTDCKVYISIKHAMQYTLFGGRGFERSLHEFMTRERYLPRYIGIVIGLISERSDW